MMVDLKIMNVSMTTLGALPLFSSLSEKELQALESMSISRKFFKGTTIFHEGDDAIAMYIIVTGKVRVYVGDNEGKEFTLNTIGAGGYFGELSLLDDEKRSATVMTTEDTVLSVIYKKDIVSGFLANSKLSIGMIRSLTSDVRKLTNDIKTLALKDVYGRTRKVLEDLAIERDGEIFIEEKMTQQDIANRIGSSREMVARTLKGLIEGDYLKVERKQFYLLKKLPEAC